MKIFITDPPPVLPPPVVTIEISVEEASFLRSILGDAVNWQDSGELGQFAKKLFCSLGASDVGILKSCLWGGASTPITFK